MTGARLQRPPIHRITVAQCAVLVVSCSLLLVLGWVHAYSALLGGLTAILPQAYFASRVFKRSGARAAEHIAHASYAGEVGKFFLTIAGFAVIFAAVRPVEAWAVFATYGLMWVIQVTGTWLLLK